MLVVSDLRYETHEIIGAACYYDDRALHASGGGVHPSPESARRKTARRCAHDLAFVTQSSVQQGPIGGHLAFCSASLQVAVALILQPSPNTIARSRRNPQPQPTGSPQWWRSQRYCTSEDAATFSCRRSSRSDFKYFSVVDRFLCPKSTCNVFISID